LRIFFCQRNCDIGEVDELHVPPPLGQPDRVAAGAAGKIQGLAGRQSVKMTPEGIHQKLIRFAEGVDACRVLSVPDCSFAWWH
jgi:hypothetical protein